MSAFFSIILASLFVSSIAFSGALLLVWKKLLTDKVITYLVSFAAGILLATAFLDLLPEATEAGPELESIFMATFFGILSFFFLERFVLWFHHHDELQQAKPSSYLILLGDGLHNFIDGVAIAAAFLTSSSVGLATTLAIAAHEAPHEIADFSVLIAGGMSKARALFLNFLSGLTAFLGAILGFYFLESLEYLLPLAIAFTAGMFIYIACSDLIPDLHEEFKKRKNWTQTFIFVLGILASWLIVRFLEG